MRKLPGLCLASALIHAATAHAVRCGTALRMAEGRPADQAPPAGLAKRVAAALPVRTLETAHFRVHYTLSGSDQAKLTADDARLRAARDSLYASLGAGADAAVYARLDAMAAPHPRFASAAAAFLEAAWRHYVDTLGMRAPRVRAASFHYGAAAGAGGKYPVDIADVGNAWPARRSQPLYGITLSPTEGGLVIENDFLYLAAPGPDGVPQGRPITSMVDGRLHRDYSREWEAGLKVTCFHEFYHSIQYAYTPDAGEGGFHVWYETGATAMEERLAPEVDDYLQYVGDLLRLLGQGMFDYPRTHENLPYGNALYHLFLDSELGAGFDAGVWERLAANGNQLPEALSRAFAARGVDPRGSHARYAAGLALAGTGLRGTIPPPFADVGRWPRLPSRDADASRSPSLGSLPPLSIHAFTVSRTRGTGMGVFLRDTSLRAVIVRAAGDSASIALPEGPGIALDGGDGASDTLLLLVANASFDRSAGAAIGPRGSRLDVEAYPYPNPAERSAGTALFSRLAKPAAVAIHGERGEAVRTLSFSPDSPVWDWDFTDGRGRKVPPGLYYYRVDRGRLAPLYVK